MVAARSGLEGSNAARPGLAFWGAVGVLFLLGLVLRLRDLDQDALFIDEAESGVNALTILEHGYPADRYLGLPLFENTLTEPWPESAEYEFRDTSYANGKAVYHGWLPLYAMAASLALHGIGPDVPADPPRVLHDAQAVHTRIRAIRLPSVLFGLLFLAAILAAGWILHGPEAGLAALLAASLAPKAVWLAQQARYYSAGLALSTLAVACAWRAWRRGRMRDFLLAGVAFVLLFHSNSLVFLILAVPCALLVPGVLRQERALAKLALFAGVVALGLLPWMLWTGYLEHTGRIPMARELLRFPADYLGYLRGRPIESALFLGLLAGLGAAWLARRRLPPRLADELERAGLPLLFLATWILAAYFGFQALVPAASCSMARLTHVVLVGPMLLGAVTLAGLARALRPERASALAAGAMLAALALHGDLARRERANPYETRAAFELIEHLRGLELAADTRLYSLPYQHFCLAFTTGLPVQSIAPVRSSFLDRYPGELLILEPTARLPHPRWARVRELAREQGVTLADEEQESWLGRLQLAMIRTELVPLVRDCRPDPGPQPAWFGPVVAALVREAAEPGPGRFDFAADNAALFAGTEPMPIDDFWPRFFYRFVDPDSRSGPNLNYAGRMREATAEILPSSWVVLHCPRRAPPPQDADALPQ